MTILTEAQTLYDTHILDAFEAKEAELAQLRAEVNTLTAQLLTAASQLATRTADLAAANTRIAELEAQLTPPATVVESRRTGPNHIRIEDLGVPITQAGLIEGAKKPATEGKRITLPANFPLFRDYIQGDGGKFMAGVMFNPDLGMRAVGISGTIDTTTGLPVTQIGLEEMSSHFTATTYASPTGGTTQSQQAAIWGYGDQHHFFEDLILVGSKQPHPHHGIRTAGMGSDKRTTIDNVITRGASQGSGNMPPEETYTIGGTNLVTRRLKMTGKLNGFLQSSTLIGAFGNMSDIDIDEASDMWAGFPIVFWQTTGTHKALIRKASRPGTGPSGKNGNLFNVEEADGTYNITIGDSLLDGAWQNPLVGGARKYPAKPAPRHEGKFPHFIVINTQSRATKKPVINVDFTGTYDTVGFVPGGLGYMADHSDPIINARIKGGPVLTPIYRPQWWVDPAGFDPVRNIWKFDEQANSSPWG